MGWCDEYQKELDELMAKWQDEIKKTLKNNAPSFHSALGSVKNENVIINDKYRKKLAEIKEKYGV